LKTSWFRAFLFSLLVFFVVSFLFWIIGYAVADLMDLLVSHVQSSPLYVIQRIVYPMGMFPWDAITTSMNMTNIGLKIFYIGFVVTLAVASIVAGLFGGSIIKSLSGWYLTSFVCILLNFIPGMALYAYLPYYIVLMILIIVLIPPIFSNFVMKASDSPDIKVLLPYYLTLYVFFLIFAYNHMEWLARFRFI